MAHRSRWLIVFTVLCIVAAILVPAIPQPAEYHQFADRRRAFGIDNFSNVVTNAGFLIAGLAGLVVIFSGRAYFEFSRERWPWVLFFAGMLLAAVGSSYYHVAPNNERLFWDRLPMTMAFAGLVASQFVDRIGVRAGLAVVVPLLVAGVASVIYWRWTEHAGAGNVVPYIILQGYVVVVLASLALKVPSRYTRANDLYWIFGWYVVGKLFEAFDAPVFAFGNIVSGHSLKHLAASGSGFVACYMLMQRTLRLRDGEAVDKRRG